MTSLRLKFAALALASVALGACSGANYGRVLVPAGGWDLYDCKQLATAATSQRNRARELEKLMTRARQGPGGELIATITYESEYEAVRTKIADLQTAMTERQCPPQQAGASDTVIR